MLEIYITIVVILGGLHGTGVAVTEISKNTHIMAINNDTITGYFIIGLLSLLFMGLAMVISMFLYPLIVFEALYKKIIKNKIG